MSEAMEYDGVIDTDDQFVILKKGTYAFKVTSVKKARHDGTGGINVVCPKVFVEVEFVQSGATSREQFFLVQKMKWKLSEFFRSIGLKKHGEPLKMDWDAVTGCTGKAAVEPYTSSGGKTYNSVASFLDPPEEKAAEEDPNGFIMN